MLARHFFSCDMPTMVSWRIPHHPLGAFQCYTCSIIIAFIAVEAWQDILLFAFAIPCIIVLMHSPDFKIKTIELDGQRIKLQIVRLHIMFQFQFPS
jgi:hypothetical protein